MARKQLTVLMKLPLAVIREFVYGNCSEYNNVPELAGP